MTKRKHLLRSASAIKEHIGAENERQVYTMAASRTIPTFKLGRDLCMFAEDYDEMLERRSAAALAEVG